MSEPDQSQGSSTDIERAEQLVDVMGQTVGEIAVRLGRNVLRGIALAREEIEDIWAEAETASHQGTERGSWGA